MTPEQAQETIQASNRALAAKRRLLLTVELSSEEEADQIMRWLYGPEKPMKATLVEVAWDKVGVPSAVAEAIETIRKSMP